jgi:2-keto-4-pentenoate hydratase/2-oxohepta-3-ene-1,7-dioic acid hydratase in catechol pathway
MVAIVSYASPAGPVAGLLLDGERVLPAGALLREGSMTVEQLLDRWDEAWPRLKSALAAGTAGIPALPLETISLLAPVARPGQVYLAGSNYRDHAAEMLRRDRAAGIARDPHELREPWHSIKAGRGTIVGPGASVAVPAGCHKFDWEAELAVVIGREASHVPVERALDHVAGYMVANDLSARDRSRRADAREGTSLYIDWLRHKSFRGACPTGPWITPAELVDPSALPIRLTVNGELRQDSSTDCMIFGIAEQIAALSAQLPLFPGDLILTGTPGGTAASHARYLQPGDEIAATIGPLGTLVTHIVAAPG